MRYPILVFVLYLGLSACESRKAVVEDADDAPEAMIEEVLDGEIDIVEDKIEVVEETVVSLDRNPKVIKITPLKSSYVVKVGDTLTYSASEHSSVGKQVNVNVSGASVLNKVSSEFKYNKPLVKGQTGGDAGVRLYKFYVQKTGNATITIQNEFRGQVKDEFIIEITAKK